MKLRFTCFRSTFSCAYFQQNNKIQNVLRAKTNGDDLLGRLSPTKSHLPKVFNSVEAVCYQKTSEEIFENRISLSKRRISRYFLTDVSF